LQVAQGNLAEALQSYRDGFVIFNRLSEGDPSNAEWLRDLSVSFEQKLKRARYDRVAACCLVAAFESYAQKIQHTSMNVVPAAKRARVGFRACAK
jgi:hypothetical protein